MVSIYLRKIGAFVYVRVFAPTCMCIGIYTEQATECDREREREAVQIPNYKQAEQATCNIINKYFNQDIC